MSQTIASGCNNILGTDGIFGCSAVVAVAADHTSAAHYYLCHADPYTDVESSLRLWINTIIPTITKTLNIQIRYQDFPGTDIFEAQMKLLQENFCENQITFDCCTFHDKKNTRQRNTCHGIIVSQAKTIRHVDVDLLTQPCDDLSDFSSAGYAKQENNIEPYLQGCIIAVGNTRNSKIKENFLLSDLNEVTKYLLTLPEPEQFKIKSQPPILIFDNAFLNHTEIIARYSFDKEGQKAIQSVLIDVDEPLSLRESPISISSGFASDSERRNSDFDKNESPTNM
jgi:hypothetical protein